jgi:Flp pilus assembly pilin Flp
LLQVESSAFNSAVPLLAPELLAMRFIADRRAVASTEYAILAAAIGLALVAAFHGISGRLTVLFHQIGPALAGHLASI